MQRVIHGSSQSVQGYLKQWNANWNLVGRVCFHLAENKLDPKRPFAFVATYTTQLSANSVPQHLQLKAALKDPSIAGNSEGLLRLLAPVQMASAQSAFLRGLVDSGSIYHAQTWTTREAYQFLKDIPLMEAVGIIVRIPNWWNKQKPPRPRVGVTIGQSKVGGVGANAILDFDVRLSLSNGDSLTLEEVESLMQASDGLVKVKGQWVEIDRERLKSVLSHWNRLQVATRDGLSMVEGLRLIAAAPSEKAFQSSVDEPTVAEWSTVTARDWLRETLAQLRDPSNQTAMGLERTLQGHLQAELRPYQMKGVKWLCLLYQLRLGGCLADDMGLGKTIQVLSLLLFIKHQVSSGPHLLVVPVSLIGNWLAEAKRFAPLLRVLVAHGAGKVDWSASLIDIDLVITTYGSLYRDSRLSEVQWDLVILDEAQMIKNPSAKQAQAAKRLKYHVRLALTGTPIENRLDDLWSLFDFISPGLLGSHKTFSKYAKANHEHNGSFLSALKNLTQPYILRRLKTDKSIINDLPDKTEVQTYCLLSIEQAQAYNQAVKELTEALNSNQEGTKRRGIVFAFTPKADL